MDRGNWSALCVRRGHFGHREMWSGEHASLSLNASSTIDMLCGSGQVSLLLW